jgi:hypothetical protein
MRYDKKRCTNLSKNVNRESSFGKLQMVIITLSDCSRMHVLNVYKTTLNTTGKLEQQMVTNMGRTPTLVPNAVH